MAQQKSLFSAYIDKYFKGIIGRFRELFNGKAEEPTYLYTSMLTQEYSPDLTWNSSSLNNSVVAADVVSMDSSLPLKKRVSLGHASGDVAKVGMKLRLKEKQISDIMVMESKGQQEADVARRILQNVPRVIRGVHTRIEIMFEQALSSGQVLVLDEEVEGTGVRVDFGYKDSNKFVAQAAPWTSSSATPISDLRAMFEGAEANSDTITDLWMSKAYFDYARKTQEVKELVAAANDQTVTDSLPVPNKTKTIEAIEDEFGVTLHIVNNSYKTEDKSGKQHPIKPWVQGNVIGTPSTVVGRLVYGTLAEDLHRVPGVTYQNSDFILVSEYSHNEPSLEEFTAAQALVMPVIDNGENIYLLDANSTSAVTVTPDSLEFSSRGGSKRFTVDSESYSVNSDSDWATATSTGKTVKVVASANEGPARQAKVTVTIGGATAVVLVSQASAE